jgi:hypothetical protein
LLRALSTSATVTPGLRRNRIAFPSLMPVAVETTLTAPDCVLPPTVIEDLVSARDRVGSVDACAAPAAIRPPARTSEALASTVATKATPRRGAIGLQRYDIRFDPFV